MNVQMMIILIFCFFFLGLLGNLVVEGVYGVSFGLIRIK